MGLAVMIVAVLMPRLALAFIYLLTDWFGRAYDSVLWPLLGFFFMPYTTAAYMAAMLNNDGHVGGVWLVLLIIAVLVDLGHLKGESSYGRRGRRQGSD